MLDDGDLNAFNELGYNEIYAQLVANQHPIQLAADQYPVQLAADQHPIAPNWFSQVFDCMFNGKTKQKSD